MKINIGDLVIFPGYMQSGKEAYLVTHVDEHWFTVSWHSGNEILNATFEITDLEEWIAEGTHKVISDEKEKLRYILTSPETLVE